MKNYYKNLIKLRAPTETCTSQKACFSKSEKSILQNCYDFHFALILGYT